MAKVHMDSDGEDNQGRPSCQANNAYYTLHLPNFRKNINSSYFSSFLFIASPYFDHEAFMHHAEHDVLDASEDNLDIFSITELSDIQSLVMNSKWLQLSCRNSDASERVHVTGEDWGAETVLLRPL